MKKIWVSLTIILCGIIAVALPVAAQETPSGIPYAELSDRIDQYVSQYIGKTSPGVVVVVVSDGEIIFSRGYGYADAAAGLPVKPDETVFEYGSVSKLFVYTTLMQLVEQDKLDLADDIRTYLPDGFLRHLRYDDPISFLDVMNHQAGFEDMLLDIVITHPRQPIDFAELLRSRQPRQVYRPGTVSAYSNYAVALAAYVAQNQLGQDFFAYLRESFFQPLDMNQTTAHPLFLDQPELMAHRARGSVLQAAQGSFQEIDWSYIPFYPVGAVCGTAEDLARFALALMPPEDESGPLFDERSTLDSLFQQTKSMGPGMTGFAHGFIEYDGKTRGVGHGGNTAGFSAQLNLVPQLRFGVVVLANAASEMELTEGVTKLLLGDGGKENPTAGGGLPDPAEVAGWYLSARRPHHGFLKLYGFLGMLEIQATGPEHVSVSFVGQTADYVQTQPYLFNRTSADGPIFRYNFRQLYFTPLDEGGFRLSGDFLPLSPGHTVPWLIADVALLLSTVLFFTLAPLVLVLIWLIRRRKNNQMLSAGFSCSGSSAGKARMPISVLLASGLFLLLNNGILVIRMLADNYRASSDVRLQLLLNDPLILAGMAAALFQIIAWRKHPLSKARRNLFVGATWFMAVLLYLMLKWQFFTC